MRSKKRAAEQDITPNLAKRARTTIDDLINKIVERYDAENLKIADLFKDIDLKSANFRKRASVNGSLNDGLNLCGLMFLAADFNLLPESVLNKLSLADVKHQTEEGPNKGITGLWLAVFVAANGRPAALNFIIQKFGPQLTVEDFRAKAEEDLDKGETVLWLAVGAAAHGHPAALNFILEKFGSQLTVEDFRAKAEEGPFKGKTVFDHVGKNALVAQLILAQTCIVDAKLNIPSIALPNGPSRLTGSPGTAALYQAKCAFLSQLNQFDAQNQEGDTDLLFEAAENAKKAGFQLSDVMLQKVYEFKFAKALSEAINHRFGSGSRMQHLSTAFTFALKILDDTKRVQLIQDIANLYIVESPQTLSIQEREQGLVPEYLLECMHSECTAEWAFKALDYVKEMRCKNEAICHKDELIIRKDETIKDLKSELKANKQALFGLLAQNSSITPRFDDLQKQGRERSLSLTAEEGQGATNANNVTYNNKN